MGRKQDSCSDRLKKLNCDLSTDRRNVMSSIPQVAEAMERVLTSSAKERERETGFVQRSTAQLDGPIFAQTTVFGWMGNPEASYAQLRHVAARFGVSVSAQAVQPSFGAEVAA